MGFNWGFFWIATLPSLPWKETQGVFIPLDLLKFSLWIDVVWWTAFPYYVRGENSRLLKNNYLVALDCVQQQRPQAVQDALDLGLGRNLGGQIVQR